MNSLFVCFLILCTLSATTTDQGLITIISKRCTDSVHEKYVAMKQRILEVRPQQDYSFRVLEELCLEKCRKKLDKQYFPIKKYTCCYESCLLKATKALEFSTTKFHDDEDKRLQQTVEK
ncbi:hypothetical protein M514_03952, partial [Trichuris suis]